MKKIICFLFLLILTLPVFAHEGEEHETPTKPSVQKPKVLETMKTVTQTVTGQKGTYHLTFTIKPAQPLVSVETQIEIKIAKPLSKPDPLLGSEAPVEEATIRGEFVATGYSSGEIKAHHEEEPGTYGLHVTLQKPNHYQLRLTAKTSDDQFTTNLPFQVSPLPGTRIVQKVDWVVILLGAVLLLVVFLSQMRKGEPMSSVIFPSTAIVLVGAAVVWIVHSFVVPRLNAPYEEARSISIPAMETKEADVVQVSLDIQKLLEIKTISVKPQLFHSYLDVPGKVTASPQNVHEIHSPVVGRVERTKIPTVGQHVRQGDVLAVVNQTLTAPEQLQVQVQDLELQNKMVEVRTRLAEARIRLSLKSKELERAKKLYEIQALALKDLQLAEAEYQSAQFEFQEAQQQVSLYTSYRVQQKIGPQIRQFKIISPVSGVVTAMDVTQGELINPEKRLFTLMDLSTVWVQAQIYEKDVAKVHVGNLANITVAAFPKEIFQGRLKIFGSVVDPQSRTVQAIFEFPNSNGDLRDGMLAMVHLKAPSRTVTAVPVSALIEEGKSYVFVRENPTMFRRHLVIPGERVGDIVEITQGLSSGDQVVAEGSYSLAAQARKQQKAGAP